MKTKQAKQVFCVITALKNLEAEKKQRQKELSYWLDRSTKDEIKSLLKEAGIRAKRVKEDEKRRRKELRKWLKRKRIDSIGGD